MIQSQGISQSSVDFPANPDITAGQFKQSVRTGDPGKNTFTVHITEFPDGQVRGDALRTKESDLHRCRRGRSRTIATP